MDTGIVRATPDDKEDILALYSKQIGKEFCPWTQDYPSADEIDYDLSRDALFILKDEGRVIAAVSLEKDESVDALPCWDEELKPAGELARLCVDPDYQGRKLAGKMLRFGMDELKRRGHKSVHFLVNRYNKKALRAYDGFGFSVVGECHMFEQDFLCYEKSL